jgi:hypothetical protein
MWQTRLESRAIFARSFFADPAASDAPSRPPLTCIVVMSKMRTIEIHPSSHHLSYILAQKEGEHTKGCSSSTLDTVLLVPSKAHIMSVCTFRDNGEATDEESV